MREVAEGLSREIGVVSDGGSPPNGREHSVFKLGKK
jgi:hypothetical protein